MGSESNRRLVVVQGLGFVGLAMAVVLSNARDKNGNLCFDVVGIDLPHRELYLQAIRQGEVPFACEDSSFAKELRCAIVEQENLHISSNEQLYESADVVVVDINLDVEKPSGRVIQEPFERAIRVLGKRIDKNCLVVVETTVPPGFCTQVALPILREEFHRRGIDSEPLLAHSYERVMPGKDYLKSIRESHRTYSATNLLARVKCQEWLQQFIDINRYALKEEESTEASELAKILENSYRAMNIAFMFEWTLLAEKMGVNLFSVIDGIKKRPTHSNMMSPGFGVGGYCLTKDALLGQWSGHELPFSIRALQVNDQMPLHVIDLMGEQQALVGEQVAVMGVSYREDIGDTRYSPSEVLYRALQEKQVSMVFHDPYVKVWQEVPQAVFLSELHELKNADVIVLATRHRQYLELSQENWLMFSKQNALFVDANNILSDEKIRFLLENNRRVVGVGKGHLN